MCLLTNFRRKAAHSLAFLARIFEGVSSGKSWPSGVRGGSALAPPFLGVRLTGVLLTGVLALVATCSTAVAMVSPRCMSTFEICPWCLEKRMCAQKEQNVCPVRYVPQNTARSLLPQAEVRLCGSKTTVAILYSRGISSVADCLYRCCAERGCLRSGAA